MVPPGDRAEELHGTEPLIGAIGPAGLQSTASGRPMGCARLAYLPVTVDQFQAQRFTRVGAHREASPSAHRQQRAPVRDQDGSAELADKNPPPSKENCASSLVIAPERASSASSANLSTLLLLIIIYSSQQPLPMLRCPGLPGFPSSPDQFAASQMNLSPRFSPSSVDFCILFRRPLE